MKIYLLLIVIILGVSLIIYNKISIVDDIITEIETKCLNNKKCEISLKNITKFKWDEIVISNYKTTSKEFDEVFQFHYSDWKEFTGQLIFLNNKKVTYIEEYSVINFEPNNKINFEFPERNYLKLQYNESTFVIDKPYPEQQFYMLTPVIK